MNEISRKVQAIYPLTPMQEGMLYHKIRDEDSREFILQHHFTLEEPLEDGIIIQALELLTLRHEPLRTLFLYRKTVTPKQIILTDRKISFSSRTLPVGDEQVPELIPALLKEDEAAGFDLEMDPLLRVAMVRTAGLKKILIFTVHHIAFDGWCIPLLFSDFAAFYTALAGGESREALRSSVLKQTKEQRNFSHYLDWMQQQDRAASLPFWKNYLADFHWPTRIRPSLQGGEIRQSLRLRVDEGHGEAVRRLAARLNVTTGTVLEVAWGILLLRHCGSPEVLFGKVISGRDTGAGEFARVVGIFINTIPVRVAEKPGQRVDQLLMEHQRKALAVMDHGHCALPELLARSGLDSGSVSTLFVHENQHGFAMTAPADPAWPCETGFGLESSGFPIMLKTIWMDALDLDITFDESFDPEDIRRLLSHMQAILGEMTARPEAEVARIEGFSREERDRVLRSFNNTVAPWPSAFTPAALFEGQVARWPEKTAVVFEGKKISYQALNRKANQLARRLREMGVRPETPVALAADRSPALLVAMLAVMKAGGCYLPLDPGYPKSRIQFILEDSGAVLMLTTGDLCSDGDVPVIDPEDVKNFKGYDGNPDPVGKPVHLACCLYTSGTTGEPKGVLLENRSLVNFCMTDMPFIDAMGAAKAPAIVSTTAFHFDIFMTETLLPLLRGWTVLLANEAEAEDPVLLSRLVTEEGGTVLQATPSRLSHFLAFPSHRGYLSRLTAILLAGETFPSGLYTLLRKHTDARIFNSYGPSETTVYSTSAEVTSERIHVGRPLTNEQIFILNGDRLCGEGMPGELCIGGIGTGRGYLNRPELNRLKFTANPFGPGTLFRTGDLACWLPDGNIRHLGRLDDQVKLRGIRLELGEIENALRRQPGIRDAAAALRRDGQGEDFLFGYVVSDDDPDPDTLRSGLRDILPDALVPARISRISRIPLTPNGKLDRQALPDLQIASAPYAPPRNPEEALVAQVFSEVLGLENIGVRDHFFSLGGHSLRAATAANMLEKRTGIRIPLRRWFDTPTVEGLAAILRQDIAAGQSAAPVSDAFADPAADSFADPTADPSADSSADPAADSSANPSADSAADPAEKTDTDPLSPAQRRIYIISQMSDPNTLYNMPMALELGGEVEEERIRAALLALTARHESLRTSFHMEKETPVQRVWDTAIIPLTFLPLKQEDPDRLLVQFIRPFSLDQPPLMRVCVWTGNGRSLLLMDMHHIISDGRSLHVILEEFAALYNGEPLPPPPRTCRDYSRRLQSLDLSPQKAWWLESFRGSIPVSDMPTDFPRPTERTHEGARVTGRIGTGLRKKLDKLAEAADGTSFMVLLAALMILLARYSRQEDIVTGCPVSGRLSSDWERTVGMFVGTLPIRGYPTRDKSFRRFLSEIKQTCIQAYEHQEYPFEALVEALNIPRDLSRNPLFDVMLSMQNDETIRAEGEKLTFLSAKGGPPPARFDLTWNISDEGDGYRVDLVYARALFRKDSARHILDHYLHLLEAAVDQPETSLFQLPLMGREERRRILGSFQSPGALTKPVRTFVARFEKQVARRPDQTAILFEGRRTTYDRLNRDANALARILLGLGLKTEDIVALYTARGPGYVIGALSIMKAGGAFLPIDPETPEGRIRFMLKDSGARFLIQSDIRLSFEPDIPSMTLKDGKPEWPSEEPVSEENPGIPIGPRHLAYCIYTSGTTGEPKGTLIEHRGLSNLSDHFATQLHFSSGDTLLQYVSCAFDPSVQDLTVALTLGGTLRLIPLSVVSDPALLTAALADCDCVSLPPQISAILQPSGLKTLITGGSAATPETVKTAEGNGACVNAYGPTEATVCATFWKHRPGDPIPRRIPIGRPLPGVFCYILDRMELCGIGVPGELCIGGIGVARGYLGRPELNREKFIPNPFLAEMGIFPEDKPHNGAVFMGDLISPLLYRTGDLAQWLPDGNLELLGRLDDQIKIRSYRVEPAEVEGVLRMVPGVTDAAVVVKDRDSDAPMLLGYYTGKTAPDPEAVQGELAETLPDYMIPRHLIRLDALPLTLSGKPDRKALPVPEESPLPWEPPADEKEALTLRILAEICGTNHIGVQADFFSSGGDSIQAIRMVSRLREAGFDITVRKILALRTVRRIAAQLEPIAGGREDWGPATGDLPLTPIQRWFFESNFPRPEHFNQTVSLVAEDGLDPEILEKSMEAVAIHHDMLRAIYPGGIQRVPAPEDSPLCRIQVLDRRGRPFMPAEAADIHRDLQEQANLTKGPLFRAALIRTGEGDYLTLCIHHLVIDGVSWRILLEDLFSACRQAAAGREIFLPSKTAPFRRWATLLWDYGKTASLQAELPWWQSALAEAKQHDLRREIPPPNASQVEGGEGGEGRLFVQIPVPATETILYGRGAASDPEILSLLLSALAIAVFHWTGQEKVSVELEGHGREELHVPIPVDRTIGWFTCTWPVTLPCLPDPVHAIPAVLVRLGSVPGHGIGYGLLAGRLNGSGGKPWHPALSFNYLGQLDEPALLRQWVPSNLPTGPNISEKNRLPNAISINGGIREGRLTLEVQYDPSGWSLPSMRAFTDAYATALTEIAHHCRAREDDGQRFEAEDLNQEEFSEIQIILS